MIGIQKETTNMATTKRQGHMIGYKEQMQRDGIIEFRDGTIDADDSSAKAAIEVGSAIGASWIRCYKTGPFCTCVACHDSDCVCTEHELLPLSNAGSDVLVSCEKCGTALHAE
jgi:hypothetical protein